MSDAPRAGWYQDPWGQYAQRWWDGNQWTHYGFPDAEHGSSADGGTAFASTVLPSWTEPLAQGQGTVSTTRKVSWGMLSLLLGAGVLMVAVVVTTYVGIEGNRAASMDRTVDMLAEMTSDDVGDDLMAGHRARHIRVGYIALVAQALWVAGFGLVLIGGGLKVAGLDRPRCPHCRARIHSDARVCAKCRRDQ